MSGLQRRGFVLFLVGLGFFCPTRVDSSNRKNGNGLGNEQVRSPAQMNPPSVRGSIASFSDEHEPGRSCWEELLFT